MGSPLNHRFSIVMREIEGWLSTREQRPFTDAVYAQVGTGALTAEDAQTLEWAWRIRNILAHHAVDGHDPVVVSGVSIRRLERIRNRVTGRVPTVAGMLGPVCTVTPDTEVGEAARTMAEHDYSCLPIVVQQDIVGVVDADMILHWLAGGLGTDGLVEDCRLEQLRSSWPDPPIAYMRADSPQRAVVSQFEAGLNAGSPLAAVLLTDEGTFRGPAKGIITPWDVASLHR